MNVQMSTEKFPKLLDTPQPSLEGIGLTEKYTDTQYGPEYRVNPATT